MSAVHFADRTELWSAQSGERLRFMLMLALLVHAVLILALSFQFPEQQPQTHTLEITLARFDDQQAPKEADFLAQAHQLGSGEAETKHEPSVRERASFESESPQLQSSRPARSDSDASLTELTEAEPALQTPETPNPSETRSRATDTFVTTLQTQEHQQVSQERQEPSAQSASRSGDSSSLFSMNSEIANLQARLRQVQDEMARRPKVSRVTSASTLADQDALYHENWRRRIEMIGNLNYPEEARKRNIHGDLQLLVRILPDGSIEQVRVYRSSGYTILDDAAIRIVQMAAPFQPFPIEMRERIDVLEIIRTWKFEKETRIY